MMEAENEQILSGDVLLCDLHHKSPLNAIQEAKTLNHVKQQTELIQNTLPHGILQSAKQMQCTYKHFAYRNEVLTCGKAFSPEMLGSIFLFLFLFLANVRSIHAHMHVCMYICIMQQISGQNKHEERDGYPFSIHLFSFYSMSDEKYSSKS